MWYLLGRHYAPSNCASVVSSRFCFACLKDWQGYQKYNVAIDYRISYVDNNNNACPLCRQGIEYSIVHETLEKAKLLLNQASELDIGDAKCTQMLDTALKSVDTVLDSEPNDIRALIVKSEILVRKDPIEAVSVCRLVLDLDRKGSIIRSQMKAQIGKSTAAAMSGRHEESERLLQPVKEAIGNKDARPVQLGIGPYRLFTVRMLMAEAYEKANQWEDAQKEYMSMGQTSKDDFNGVPHKDHTTADRMHKICSGMSRCVYQLGSFKGAMSTAEVALSLDRRCPGVHKLIA